MEQNINTDEEKLIDNYTSTYEAYSKAGDELHKHFLNKHIKEMDNAKTWEDLRQVKEALRVMPESVGKVLIFRGIILREEILHRNGITASCEFLHTDDDGLHLWYRLNNEDFKVKKFYFA